MPPVHSSIFFAFDFFGFVRPRRRPGGGSAGVPRRLRGPGTSVSGTPPGASPGSRTGALRAPVGTPPAPRADLRGPGTGRLRCGRPQSQFVVAGVRVEYPLVCGVDIVRPPTALRVHGCLSPPSGPRGALSPYKRRSVSRSSSARPQDRPRGRVHRIAHTIRPVQRQATTVTNSTCLQLGNPPYFSETFLAQQFPALTWALPAGVLGRRVPAESRRGIGVREAPSGPLSARFSVLVRLRS